MQSIQEFVNKVICGDSVAIMRDMPSASVDFILTDPPYLVNYQSRDGRSVPNDTNDAWLKPVFAEAYRVLKPNTFCVSFYGWNAADRFLTAWKAAGLRPVAHLVWIKDYDSRTRMVRYCHEAAYLLAKGNPQPRVVLRDVLYWVYSGNALHPTQKPVASLLPLIRAYSRPGDIVLDPFAGSGSAALAARILKRQYIGIEMNETYCRIAQRRLHHRAETKVEAFTKSHG